LCALAVHPSAILRAQILDQKAFPLLPNEEMPPGERVIGDQHIGTLMAANSHRVIADFPPLRDCAVLIQ
jgi:hypothetical protein